VAEHRVVVVGAGVAGLVSGLLLAARGLDVTIVDAADGPGGKMRPVTIGGQPVDAGPTVFTMRWVFDELLDEVGSSTAEALPTLEPLSLLARHAWSTDGSRLDLHVDRQRSAEAIAAWSSADEARRYLAFCEEAAQVYRRLEGPHIRSQRPGLARMIGDLGPRGLAVLAGLGPGASMAQALARRFRDPRLQQLFGRYATYCGASPWQAPATLMLVAHVEQEGVWAVQGGMSALALALADLLQARGGRLRWGSPCVAIEQTQGRVRSVRLASGQTLPADAVVYNGDVSALGPLLGSQRSQAPPPVPAAGRSLSAMTWAVRAPATGFPLVRHNVFFDDDYASEFRDVFQHRRLPQRGTVYVCAQDRDDAAVAAQHDERLLVLVNAPADGDTRSFIDSETEACQSRCMALLRRCGLTLDLAHPATVRRTPHDFQRLFPGSGGALYGPATHGWMALFRRASSRSTGLEGLFLAGGSVHPGPGVPMAAMSGRLAAAALMDRLGSTRRSHRAPTSGGTSTRSATTGAMP
jgi:1-hydroxycarotenoid 3,4-desaturase